VFKTVGTIVPHLRAGQLISLESTTYPGTTEEELKPRIEKRGFKAGKEEIVGLVTALRLFVERDWDAERQRWERQLHAIVAGLADVPTVRAEYLERSEFHPGLPHARLARGPGPSRRGPRRRRRGRGARRGAPRC